MKIAARLTVILALVAALAAVIVAKRMRSAPVAPGPVAPSAVSPDAPVFTPAPDAPQPQPAEAIASTASDLVVPLPRLVDLGAKECIPCKMLAPILEQLTAEYKGRLDVVFIDVWENPAAGQDYNIRLIPTQIFFDAQGKELWRHQGFISKDDILAKWKEFGVDLPQGAPVPAPE